MEERVVPDRMSPELERLYDAAMFSYSQGDWEEASGRLEDLLGKAPDCFEARLSLGMARCRMGDLDEAIRQGERALALRPDDPLAHTNLSIFFQRAGDIGRAESHGAKARIASWKGNMAPPEPSAGEETELSLAPPGPRTPPAPRRFPDMPWKSSGAKPGSSPD